MFRRREHLFSASHFHAASHSNACDDDRDSHCDRDVDHLNAFDDSHCDRDADHCENDPDSLDARDLHYSSTTHSLDFPDESDADSVAVEATIFPIEANRSYN